MKEKLNNLVRKKYILFGIPLLCGAIIGTTITLSIPHVKADAVITNSVSSDNTTPIPVAGNSGSVTITNHIDPTSVPPTNSPVDPTSVPQAQPTTTSGNGGGQATQPCH